MIITNTKYVGQILTALNVDAINGCYTFNGIDLAIPGRTDKEIASADASLDLPVLEAQDALTACHRLRAEAYPPVADYLDAIVKRDSAAVQAYKDACLAVKASLPLPV